MDFENDKAAGKRARLVARLLNAEKYTPRGSGGKPAVSGAVKVPTNYADEYTEHWANIWTVWLMTRTGHPLYRDQMRTWLEIQFSKNVSHKDLVTALLTATGKSNDVGAVNFIVHHLGDALTGAEKGKFGNFDAVPITSRVTKLFLGLQTQCTQCHDHPFAKEWVQSDFWGVNAFFRQTVRSATPSAAPGNGNNGKMDNPVQITLSDEAGLNSDAIVLYERRDGKRMASYPVMLKDIAQAEKGELSAKRLTGGSGTESKNRRKQLAEWVTNHDNFNKAFVNRIWGHLFGRGLNKEPSIDDFSSNNEVVHPELLNYLAEEFAKYNHDPKRLLEWICNSDVYQLSHVAAKDSADSKFDPFFARMQLKALSPEVLFESLMVATKAEVRANADQRKGPPRPVDAEARPQLRGRRGERAELQRDRRAGPADDERVGTERRDRFVGRPQGGRQLAGQQRSRGRDQEAGRHPGGDLRRAVPDDREPAPDGRRDRQAGAGPQRRCRGEGGQRGSAEGPAAERPGPEDDGRRVDRRGRVVGDRPLVLPGRVLGAAKHERVHAEPLTES